MALSEILTGVLFGQEADRNRLGPGPNVGFAASRQG